MDINDISLYASVSSWKWVKAWKQSVREAENGIGGKAVQPWTWNKLILCSAEALGNWKMSIAELFPSVDTERHEQFEFGGSVMKAWRNDTLERSGHVVPFHIHRT